jgi:hypothetical protein
MNTAMSLCSLRVVFSAVIAMAGAACGSDPPPVASTPTSGPAASTPAIATPSAAPDACSEIAGVCHMHDGKGGAALIHECHELGHAHKLDACVARKQECLDACADHAH